MNISETELQALLRRGNVRVAATSPAQPSVTPSQDVVQPPAKTNRSQGKSGSPNKSETEYGRMLAMEFPDCKIVYEGITLTLDTGHRYTADWNVHLPDGKILLVEVKNAAYKHASYGRSKLAYATCKLNWPMFLYRWAERTKNGWEKSGA